MRSAIALRNLTKRFGNDQSSGEAPAVDAVNLEVKKKELLVMVGPSGCGKSTILRMIAGLEEPTAGEIYIDGRRVDSLPARNRNIGFMFQGYALFMHMTVAQNIVFGLKIKGGPKAERRRRLDELVTLLGLQGLEDRKPSMLSGGQQQRVALARAMAPSPEVLLLDEPFGAVDAKVRQKLRADTKRWQREVGIPTILVTHDQLEALELGDRVAVMNEGRFEQVDTPQKVYDSPATEFVGRFIGKANIFQTDLSRGLGELLDTTRLVVMVRPEDISVSPWRNGNPPEKDQMLGTIVGQVFLGRTVRLDVRLEGGSVVTVALPKHEAFAGGLTPDKTVALGVESSQVFPSTPDSQNGSSGTAQSASGPTIRSSDQPDQSDGKC